MSRQSRRAVVMADIHEAGRGNVIAPSVEIEEAGIAIVAQALLVIPSRSIVAIRRGEDGKAGLPTAGLKRRTTYCAGPASGGLPKVSLSRLSAPRHDPWARVHRDVGAQRLNPGAAADWSARPRSQSGGPERSSRCGAKRSCGRAGPARSRGGDRSGLPIRQPPMCPPACAA